MLKFFPAIAAALSCAALTHVAAAADTYPTHSITLIVSAPPGSTPDAGARALSQWLSEDLKQPVVVENRPGANGLIAAQAVAKNPDDGYTLLVAPSSTMTINPHIYKKQSALILTAFTPVAKIYSTDFCVIVRPDSGINSIADLIRMAKAKPGALTAANGGPGSASQMAIELLKQQAGIDLYQVPFNNSPAGALAVAAGNADLLIETRTATEPFVASGRVKRIAMTGAARSDMFPGVPTVAESGVPGYQMSAWGGVFARKSVAPDRLARLSEAMAHALAKPQMETSLRNVGLTLGSADRAQFERQWRDESARWAEVVARTPGLQSNE
jgi:tripartite-type tricarboxylate transporter receptor subunit TctC